MTLLGLRQGALEAVSLETAYNKLAGKWQGYFERSRDDGSHADSEATPLPGKGTRRSLFQKSRIPSRSQARAVPPLCTPGMATPASSPRAPPWSQIFQVLEMAKGVRDLVVPSY